ncbi:alpha/beta fold hydrolase [Gordonia sp. ABSL1-1]|uniref:PE-PPE domain-containing protein n=1 Tax=Gordonia sp. ABSL1-1 TaxID=3053923 RepID=UPI002572DF0C|nr:PE-PPE domain-containing protein [Gordonia sp. ABSL1-1]MDL9938671.1 alpha/beta fold hydrolase [Gordonia sp. ABSL1-1]
MLLWCDGTWSRPGARSAVSESLRRTLGDRLSWRYVDYPASFGPATATGDLAYAESVAVGVHELADAARDVDGPVIVGGYSQGAAVAVAYARLVGSDDRPLAVATLGDPHHPVHLGRSGIAGALSVPCRRMSVYAPGDPIADLPLGSPLRSLADLGAWMSVRDLAAARQWGEDVLRDVLDARRMQQWWRNPAAFAGLLSAAGYARGYLGTAHTTDYITGGHVGRLACMIEEAAA